METLTLPGPKARSIVERDRAVISPSYPRGYPFVMDHGRGTQVWDVDDNRFLDFAAGIAVVSTGHSHPNVVKAIQEQAEKFIHISSDFYHSKWVELGEYLNRIAPFDEPAISFMTNSGTESIEAAIKLARYYTGRSQFIAFLGGFHGRTMGSVSLTASKSSYHKGFAPLMNGVLHAPFPDTYHPILQSLPGEDYGETVVRYIEEQLLGRIVPAEEVAGILVEPIQGEGGYIVPPPGFFPALRKLCDRYGILLIADEVQAGVGRTGKWWSIEHFGVQPDIICLAKGIASGVPLGAMVARSHIATWPRGSHGNTFGGNPLACAAAVATLDLIEKEYLKNAAEVGQYTLDALAEMQMRHPSMGEVRGIGLMIGVEFVKNRQTHEPFDKLRDSIVELAFERGLLTLGCGKSVIRISPPLCVSTVEIDEGLTILDEAITLAERGSNQMLPDFRVRQRDYLLEIARALTQELDLDKLLGRILRITVEMLAGQAGLIALRSETGGWRVRASHGLPAVFLRIVEPALAQIPLSTEDSEDIELPEINRVLQDLTRAASLGLLSSLGLPLVARGTVVGVIFIFPAYMDNFSNNDLALLRSFADQAAIAVQNAQFYSQINQERQRMNALLDSAADGILILSADHKVERCNPAAARMIGIEGKQAIGKPHGDIVRWTTPPQGLTLEQAEAGGWPLTPHAQLYVEGNLKRLTGAQTPLPVGITYAPLLSTEGTILNVFATLRDITRFRQAEELKSTFISIISHELKTPVALIKGYVSTLRREDANWDRKIVQDSLQVIEEEADHLTALIENMLEASRLQAGGLSIKRSDVALPPLAARLAERFRTQTTRHTILVDFPPDFPVILADETRIEQVVSNLISNSIKYAPQGEIRISGQTRPDKVIVCVSDQGPGIAPEDLPHVFDRFYRAPEASRQTKGAGLGLYLSRAIIEAHGGNMWVDPESGHGARICFSLPRLEE